MRVKMSKQPPPAPTASAEGLAYCNPNCRTPRHWKFPQHHRTTRPPQSVLSPTYFFGSRRRFLLRFCVKLIFSETIRARAMKLGSCIHLETQGQGQPKHQFSVLTYFLWLTDFANFSFSFCFQVLINYKV